MGKLRILTAVFIFLFSFTMVVVRLPAGESVEQRFSIDWVGMELEVSGMGRIIPSEYGNHIDWQYGAALKAEMDLISNFVASMSELRLDAYSFARDLLMSEPYKNEHIYNYIKGFTGSIVEYSDEWVRIKTNLPMFGENGFTRYLVTAGLDPGRFPLYTTYEYSSAFTGVVIDARDLARIPAIGPRIFDEDHRTVYSLDIVDKESFARWGAVQYTYDPYYKGFNERVGDNPYRIVAMENDTLISTDIGISNKDARTLLQDEVSRKNLREGRVIIILEKQVLKSN